MPENDQTTSEQGSGNEQQETTAEDFAKEVARVTQYAKDWKEIKDSMVKWLRANVGSGINQTITNLDDYYSEKNIKQAEKDFGKAASYLRDAKSHMMDILSIYDNPVRMSNNPGYRSEDNSTKTVAEITGWKVGPSEQGENEGT